MAGITPTVSRMATFNALSAFPTPTLRGILPLTEYLSTMLVKNPRAEGLFSWRMEKKMEGRGSCNHQVRRGTLSFYTEQGFHKTRASWYFRDDILVKKVFKEYRYFGGGYDHRPNLPLQKD